jgi:hypothetical protein
MRFKADPLQSFAHRGSHRWREEAIVPWGRSAARLRPIAGLDDFDRYIEEHRIHEANYPAAFALWIAEVTGGPAEDREGRAGEAGELLEGVFGV